MCSRQNDLVFKMAYRTKRPNKREVSSDPAVRRRVKLRYNNRCAATRVSYLGYVVKRCKSIGKLAIDHIIELDWDGLDIEPNLQPLCKTCHKRKTHLNNRRRSSVDVNVNMSRFEKDNLEFQKRSQGIIK